MLGVRAFFYITFIYWFIYVSPFVRYWFLSVFLTQTELFSPQVRLLVGASSPCDHSLTDVYQSFLYFRGTVTTHHMLGYHHAHVSPYCMCAKEKVS
ncbi:hypothetical protein CY34DRAFT_684437 [Suillus luteus UH-Slu-Lm8-n1]|uniref:Uncharacterized protein n=1 Tax=Suillus luteus UH-Slu-Lm8-n1 TaxID=930992 RepID=A0A0C9ZWI0_9AGAM|nr:hypothetical protein CY34DRAFT_684437 [Suillus luteus UH-Slu-Lm8-n1]